VVVAAVAGLGYYVFKKQKGSNSLSDAAKQALIKCDYEDKNLCKFFASWKDSKYYTINSTTITEGKTSTMKIEYVAPDKYHMVSTAPAYETITIGDVVYTKDNSDGKWWKQTPPKEEADRTKEEVKIDFDEPDKDKPAEQQTQYKFITKEACGNLTCFKYQVIDPTNKETTEYIWFDDKDYQLRKTSSEYKDGRTESTFSYSKIEIKEPSPVKELGHNQMPNPTGGTIDGPSEAELRKLQQQAEQLGY
jgi:hypothetical protein